MRKPKKWEPTSRAILSVPDFEDARHGNRVVFVPRYFQGRAVSIRFVANMSFAVVMDLIYQGGIYDAKVTDEYNEWLRSEMLGE